MSGYIKRELLNIEDYSKYYSVRIYCTNCGKRSSIYVIRGKTKPMTVSCEGCGCNTAKT